MSRRVELSDHDVETIQRIAVACSRDLARPGLTCVQVLDGMAYATDSYRLAFAEVECEDVSIPREVVSWFPPGGLTVTVDEARANPSRGTLTWKEGSEVVGGHWFDGITKERFDALTTEAPKQWSAPVKPAPPAIVELGEGKQDVTLIESPSGLIPVDAKFLSSLVAITDCMSLRIGAAGPRKPLWLVDDETTCLLMPLRLGAKNTWQGRDW